MPIGKKMEGQFMKQYMDSVLLKPVKDENELELRFNKKEVDDQLLF